MTGRFENAYTRNGVIVIDLANDQLFGAGLERLCRSIRETFAQDQHQARILLNFDTLTAIPRIEFFTALSNMEALARQVFGRIALCGGGALDAEFAKSRVYELFGGVLLNTNAGIAHLQKGSPQLNWRPLATAALTPRSLPTRHGLRILNEISDGVPLVICSGSANDEEIVGDPVYLRDEIYQARSRDPSGCGRVLVDLSQVTHLGAQSTGNLIALCLQEGSNVRLCGPLQDKVQKDFEVKRFIQHLGVFPDRATALTWFKDNPATPPAIMQSAPAAPRLELGSSSIM